MKNKMEFTQKANEVSKAKEILTKNGYYTGNLWHTEDVTSMIDCTEKQAEQILDSVFDGDRINNEVWESIQYIAQDMGLSKK
tara:strand:+ start:1032 stop:1277 length:246 start_codon:yes stop_codon:yes gene_type:complete